MADYKDIINGTITTIVDKAKEFAASDTVTGLVDKVKSAAEESGVSRVYEQGSARARTYARIAKLTLELNGAHEELDRVYKEIGKLYFEQAKDAPEGFFVPLFEQANRITGNIRAKRARIEELKETYGVPKQNDIDVEIGDFDDVVSATEADGMTVEIKSEEK